VKTTFKLKINIKRNPLNFKSIQLTICRPFQSGETIPLLYLYYFNDKSWFLQSLCSIWMPRCRDAQTTNDKALF
jgi:hypothetical protein